jgi:hypothetical protein
MLVTNQPATEVTFLGLHLLLTASVDHDQVAGGGRCPEERTGDLVASVLTRLG